MAKDRNDQEIAELLKQLKETTASEAEAPVKKQKKQKPMTDDDVKDLLRKYYSDIDAPEQSKSEFDIDTSDFLSPEDINEETDVGRFFDDEDTDVVKPIEDDSDALTPQEIAELEHVEETEKLHVVEKPIDTEGFTDEESLEEIIYNFDVDFDTTERFFDFEEKYANTPVTEIKPVSKAPQKEEAGSVFAEEYIEEPIDEPLDVCFEVDDPADESEETSFDIADPKDEPEEAAFDVADESDFDQFDRDEKSDDVEDTAAEPEEIQIHEEDTDTDASVEEPLEAPNEEIFDAEFAEDTSDAVIFKESNKDEIKEWKPSVDISGRLDDSELDLMVALGFGDKLRDKYGDERVRLAEEKNRLTNDRAFDDVSAFGYRGREYTKLSDPKKIFGAFNADRLRLLLELFGTVIFAALLFLFENITIFNIPVSGVFNGVTSPALHSAVSLALLIVCAAFSYRRIFGGILMAFGRKRAGNPAIALTFVAVVLYDIIIIIFSPADGAILYNFPVALGLLFDVASDLMEYKQQRTVFSCLNSKDSGELYGFCDHRIDNSRKTSVSARKISFIEGYFRHMGRCKSNIGLLVIFIAVAIVGALIATAAAVFDIPLGKSLSAFAAVFAFASPMSYFFGRAWQKLLMTFALNGESSGVIGEPSDEQLNVDYVVFDDRDALPSSCADIVNFKVFDNFNINDTLYFVNSLFSAVGGPLSEKLREISENVNVSKAVKLTGAADHYVEAVVDGDIKVSAGSYSALVQRGYNVPWDNSGENGVFENSTFMYTAINGTVCARFCVKYLVSNDFVSIANTLASEGLGVKIRTLDPNIDRGLLFSIFGEQINSGIIREPQIDLPKNSSAVTAVFSRGNIKGLAEALVCAKRMKRIDAAMNVTSIVQVIIGILMSAALFFCGAPASWMSVAAAVMQLTCVIPAIIIYFLLMYKNNG